MNNQKKINIDCFHFDRCSGCRTDKDVARFDLFDEAATFFAKHGFPSLQLQVGSPIAWRCRVKLAVRGSAADPQIGLFEEGSHRVVNIPQCQVHHPAINAVVGYLVDWVRQHNIVPYNETLGSGLLRYIQLTVDPREGKVQVGLVFNLGSKECVNTDLKESLRTLWEQHGHEWNSLWVNFNTRRDNVIMGEEWWLVYGEPLLKVSYCGQGVYYHPASFFQANPEMFERLVKGVVQAVAEGASVVEYYAGVGAIGLALVNKAQRITCAEIVSMGMPCFDEAVSRLSTPLQEKLSYRVANVKTCLDLLTPEIDTVIVDPPRKGLDNTLLKALNGTTTVKMLIYVSCGWEGFVRDFDELIAGGWRLAKVEVFLFFPGSELLEVLAIFSR